MWTPTPQLAAALTGNHTMTTRVTVLNQETGAVVDIPIRDGTVTATLGNRITRAANLKVDKRLTDDGLLNPLRDVLTIRTGVDRVGEVPVFTGRVIDTADTATGDVTVHGLDRGHDIAKASFEQPWATIVGAAARDEIRRIVTDLDPSWGVDTARAPMTAVPALVWEEDRGKALDDIAAGISCLLQGDRVGGFVLYPNPFSLAVGTVTAVDATIVDGEHGAIVAVSHTRSGEQIYNAVTARDAGTTSPTRWGGPFGRRNRLVKVRTPLDTAGATALATRVLNQSLALARNWQISLPHYPLLDPGDIAAVRYSDELTFQVVESVRHNLRAADTTQVTTRQLHQIDTMLTE
jgi:hypothetical protein